jgi:NitT/TauT family transport system substrate-binding protein
MKKILVLLIGLMLVGCGSEQIENNVSVIVPSGIPLLAVGNLIGTKNVTIEDVNNPSLLVAAMTSKSHDIIIAPLNLGAKAFIEGGSDYQLAGILTFGNTYVITRNTQALASVSDLSGKAIMAFGQNSTPDIVLKAALGTESVIANISYQANVNLVLPFFLTNTNDPADDSNCDYPYILAAEPVISTLEINYSLELNILDLQEVLGPVIARIPQAGVFVNPDGASLEDIEIFLELLQKNTEELNDDPEAYAALIAGKHAYFSNLTAETIARSIPRSNIEYVTVQGDESFLDDYYALLNLHNPGILGGSVPEEGFYR